MILIKNSKHVINNKLKINKTIIKSQSIIFSHYVYYYYYHYFNTLCLI